MGDSTSQKEEGNLPSAGGPSYIGCTNNSDCSRCRVTLWNAAVYAVIIIIIIIIIIIVVIVIVIIGSKIQ